MWNMFAPIAATAKKYPRLTQRLPSLTTEGADGMCRAFYGETGIHSRLHLFALAEDHSLATMERALMDTPSEAVTQRRKP